MALTALQRDISRLLAAERRATGESYVAGGVALTVALGTMRLSRDLDIFHDSIEAVGRSWDRDRGALEAAGYGVRPLRERPGFVEALVRANGAEVVMEWAADSAFRFFPLVEHPELGLALHPFDLATNKVLALVGRLEVRDWIDVLACHERLQRLGYLAWAASGKDPGFTPLTILEQARRSGRYTDVEIAALAFEGPPPRATELSVRWHRAVEEAEAIVVRLPPDRVGQAVLTADGTLFAGLPEVLPGELAGGGLRFHAGRLRGAWPAFRV